MKNTREENRGRLEAPVFSWDAPEVFLAFSLEQQRAALEGLDPGGRESWLLLLETDSRKGRRDLARRLRRSEERRLRVEEHWRAMSAFDARMAAGAVLAGVDEVGRGPLAGPVTAAAVILPPGYHAPGLDDSKRLSAARREEWSARIREDAVAWQIRDLSAGEVDRLGIREAVFRVMAGALADLSPSPERILVDGRETPPGVRHARAVIGGDGLSLSVAAASVIAKVHRDALMVDYACEYPGYGFEGNKGYGSAGHQEALRRLGPCPLHRRSFIGRILDTEQTQPRSPR